MRRFGKRFGVEFLFFLCATAVGMFIWVAIASYYENLRDAYWTANGHPTPPGMYRAPREWRFVILLAPYLMSIALRICWPGAKRLRRSAATEPTQ
jgi:hypothetical protein